MASITKISLSGGTNNGLGTLVAATSIGSSPTVIHTGSTDTAVWQELWIWAFNVHTAAVELTLGFGGVATKDLIKQFVPHVTGLVLVCPGLILKGTASTGLSISAAAVTANVISLFGYVHNIA